MSDSIVQAQRRNFEHFTMQDLMNLEVQFSNLQARKPPQDGKEWYQGELHFKRTGTPTRETRMALGNQLLTRLSIWTLLRTNKPRLNLTISNDKGKILLHYVNIKLHAPCFQHALIYHKVNQGIMDEIADRLLRNPSSTDFVMDMTLHEE